MALMIRPFRPMMRPASPGAQRISIRTPLPLRSAPIAKAPGSSTRFWTTNVTSSSGMLPRSGAGAGALEVGVGALGAHAGNVHALLLEQADDRLGRLSADVEPVRGTLGVHAERLVGGLAGIVVAELLDVVGAPLLARVDDDDAVVRVALGAHAHQADLDHADFSSVSGRASLRAGRLRVRRRFGSAVLRNHGSGRTTRSATLDSTRGRLRGANAAAPHRPGRRPPFGGRRPIRFIILRICS